MTEAQRRRTLRKVRRDLDQALALKKAVDRFFAALYRARRKDKLSRPPCRCGGNCGQC